MATYNGEKHIKEQLDSILCQLNEEDEVVVSDDGSTDNTLDIVRSYNDPRIKVFINSGIHGYGHNFENAMKYACGDYIFLSDQDDVWLPNKVNMMLPFLKDGDNLVLCNGYMTNEKLEKQCTINEWRRYRKGYWRNLYKNTFWGCTFAFTKRIKDYCLPIPMRIKGHDAWIGLLCELKFNVVYVNEPLLLYRRHNSNISHRQTIFGMIRSRGIFLIETLKHITIHNLIS
jgi:glycosyltransferase involved in cell wall biosynthesis